MVRRVLLVRHAPTAATGCSFAADEPITGAAVTVTGVPTDAEAVVVCSPKLRCRQTAAAAGFEPAIEPVLTECDFGSWEGRAFADIDAAGWLADPDAAPHGGESLTAFAARVSGWLDAVALDDPRPLVAFTHAGVIRAAVVHALGAALDAFWRIEVQPLSVCELRRYEHGWTVAL